MRLAEINRLKSYLEAISERELWAVITEYFQDLKIQAAIVHSPSEHGMDVVAFVPENLSIIGRGYNILVQAKSGNLTLDKWRKDVLFQLLETPYYRIDHPSFNSTHPRRIILILSGTATAQARDSIGEFNSKHQFKVELIEINDLIDYFIKSGFAKYKLEQITGVGDLEEPGETAPPEFGIDGQENS